MQVSHETVIFSWVVQKQIKSDQKERESILMQPVKLHSCGHLLYG